MSSFCVVVRRHHHHHRLKVDYLKLLISLCALGMLFYQGSSIGVAYYTFSLAVLKTSLCLFEKQENEVWLRLPTGLSELHHPGLNLVSVVFA